MFIKKRSNILYRDFHTFGYLTDNRNFGYKLKNANEGFVGDKIVSQSGAIFLSALSGKPQKIDDIASKINNVFPSVDFIYIKEDAIDFFSSLEKDGFVIIGDTIQECNEKDTRFSYRDVVPKYSSVLTTNLVEYSVKSTQEFFDNYFENQPQLTNIHIEITSRCNERCIHCYIPNNNRKFEIDPSAFESIIRQCKEMNVLHLTISGGEPMSHRNFIDFIKMCREYEFSINVLSNLTMLTDEIVDEMRLNYLLGVQVSLYSMKSAVHDEITGIKGSFDKTKKSILKLVENNIPLQIACPILKNNKSCYQDVVDWASSLNVSSGTDYVVLAKYDHSTDNLSCRLSIEEVESVLRKTFSNYKGIPRKNKNDLLGSDELLYENNVCNVCYSSVCINEKGNVYPCAGWQDYVVGNVKSSPLKEIWFSSERVKYLRGMRRRDFPKCIQCSDREYCTMCLVRNANEEHSGDPLVVNPYYCAVAKLKKEILTSGDPAFGEGGVED